MKLSELPSACIADGNEEIKWVCPDVAARDYNAASSLTRYAREGLELLPE